jgi:hypothetical protein
MIKKYLGTNMREVTILVSLCVTSTFAQSGLPERIINLDFLFHLTNKKKIIYCSKEKGD